MARPLRRPPHRCCIVWAAYGGALAMVCIHCSKPAGQPRPWCGSAELLALQVQRSRDGHAAMCRTAVRPTFRAA